MKLELHILQNFAPSNLNRDDTGAPKDCQLGGHRRARISSQCLKRAVRDAFQSHGMFGEDELAVRTKRIVENVADLLVSEHQREREAAIELAAATLAGAGLKVKGADDNHKSKYLIFLPKRHLSQLANLINTHWDTIKKLGAEATASPTVPPEAKGTSKRKDKAQKKGAFPKEMADELIPIFEDAARTPDLALFGRMIADAPSWNVDAACQVAHAISTNRVAMEFDFYTAVDDLRPHDTAGSGMMGTVQFNSSCYYRYAVLDTDDLRENLGDDGNVLAGRTAAAFVRASVLAIPTGKQNSMAAHNPPSFVLAIARRNGTPVSLANAFCNPVRPNGDSDLVGESIVALRAYLGRMCAMYGTAGLDGFYIADRDIAATEGAVPLENKKTLDALVEAVEKTIRRT